MKKNYNLLLLSVLFLLTSCASGYKIINPKSLNYISKNTNEGLVLEYKYDLLANKKYQKKELKNNMKLVAVKITNNSEVDYVFGKDVRLSFENGNDAQLLEKDKTFASLKQSPASYLWYLLLIPVRLYSNTNTSNNGIPTRDESSSFPIGFILGPSLAGGNILAASSANTNFKKELTDYDLIGKTIKKGETVYGIVGIQSSSYEGLKLKF
jgi:hypothetical protein